MTDEEIKNRAALVRDALWAERGRFDSGPMWSLLMDFGGIAGCVSSGEYHREDLFRRCVRHLSDLGFDMDGMDTETRPRSTSVEEAARNASNDTYGLWVSMSDDDGVGPMPFIEEIVSSADDLMAKICTESYLDDWIVHLSKEVSDYIDYIDGTKAEAKDADEAKAEAVSASDLSDCLTRKMSLDDALHVEVPRWTITGTCREVHREGPGPKGPEPHGDAWDLPVKVIRQMPRDGAKRRYRATVCRWDDGTETHAVCSEGTPFDPVTGLALCLVKRMAALKPGMSDRDLRKFISETSESNARCGIADGMDPDMAYRTAVMDAGSRLYAKCMRIGCGDHWRTFHAYLNAVLDMEAYGAAEPTAVWFLHRLLKMRREVAELRAREEHERDLDFHRYLLTEEAVSHGASGFEAWRYACENAPDCGVPKVHVSISIREEESIRRQAVDEARARILALRGVG